MKNESMKAKTNNNGLAKNLHLKTLAKEYIVVKKWTNKRTGEKIGVTEDTVGKWVKMYGWLDIERAALIKNNLAEFIAFAKKEHPENYAAILAAYNDYISPKHPAVI